MTKLALSLNAQLENPILKGLWYIWPICKVWEQNWKRKHRKILTTISLGLPFLRLLFMSLYFNLFFKVMNKTDTSDCSHLHNLTVNVYFYYIRQTCSITQLKCTSAKLKWLAIIKSRIFFVECQLHAVTSRLHYDI